MSKPSPPFISTGTSQKEKEGSVKSAVASVVSKEIAKVLGQSPKEVYSDIMDIPKKSFKILWRPNNYRRQMFVKEVQDIPLEKLRGVYKDFKVSKKNLVFVRDYPGVLLILGRRCLQGVWCQPVRRGQKEVIVVERSSVVELARVVDEKKLDCLEKIDFAMRDFVAVLGLHGLSGISWQRSENWIKGEDFLPKVPSDLIMYDSVFKKVYSDDGLEFVSGRGEDPTVLLKHYVKNHALKDVAPEIACSLDSLALEVSLLKPRVGSLERVQAQIKVFPTDLLREDVACLVRGLSRSERLLLSEWTFERFCL